MTWIEEVFCEVTLTHRCGGGGGGGGGWGVETMCHGRFERPTVRIRYQFRFHCHPHPIHVQ